METALSVGAPDFTPQAGTTGGARQRQYRWGSDSEDESTNEPAVGRRVHPVVPPPEKSNADVTGVTADTIEEMEREDVPGEGDDDKENMQRLPLIEKIEAAKLDLAAALERRDAEYQSFVERLNGAEATIIERLRFAHSRKSSVASEHGNPHASADDLLEINAGGSVVAARRGALCQFDNTRLASLFDGSYERRIRRDRNGRMFLDVNPVAFRSLVDYLNDICRVRSEVAECGEEAEEAEERSGFVVDPPGTIDEGDRSVLLEMLSLFGVADKVMPQSEEDLDRVSIDNGDDGSVSSIFKGIEATDSFAPSVNDALNSRLAAMRDAGRELLHLESGLDDHRMFIDKFASGTANDLVSLNVSGMIMTTRRSTLRVVKDSVLSRTDQEEPTNFVYGWSPEDVGDWIDNIADVPDGLGDAFRDGDISGRTLLALDRAALEGLCHGRAGTACLLQGEVRNLARRSGGEPPFFESSPYCVGRILDCLRSRRLRADGVVVRSDEEAVPPVVRESERARFRRTVEFFFPGDSAKSILAETS